MKRLSFQWRITLLTALLIAGTCICLNLLLYHSGAVSMDSLNGFVFEYTPESSEDPDGIAIEISDSQMSEFISRFSDEVYDVKADFGRNGWLITITVTIISAAIAYFVSGQALKPLRKLSQQAEKIDQDSISDIRLNEDTVKEFRQLSVSVNLMLDRLSESFATQRQFSGNAAHELRTPLAIMQTKLELFAAEHRELSCGYRCFHLNVLCWKISHSLIAHEHCDLFHKYTELSCSGLFVTHKCYFVLYKRVIDDIYVSHFPISFRNDL